MPLKPPSYRRQRVKGGYDRAFVEVSGRRHWLGRYGTNHSQQRYVQFVAEWQATGGLLAAAQDRLTIDQLAAAFMDHARVVYRRADGGPLRRRSCRQGDICSV